ncbi:MAG: hypothetical protein HYS62_03660 [Candidatus Aenigmarchaeota archaeon]|nr:hypothetical protein [Candidatus Aenigmarchaeota archaeon]
MRYKKFLLIPAVFLTLVFLYVNFIGVLADYAETVRQSSNAEKSATGEVIGVGHAVSVQVKRATTPYLFGMVSLPAFAQGVGNLTVLHTVFFWSLYFLTAILTTVFIIIERRDPTMVKNGWGKSATTSKSMWMRLGKAVGIGALFALVAFLISGDASSLPLGMLVAYLEFKFS